MGASAGSAGYDEGVRRIAAIVASQQEHIEDSQVQVETPAAVKDATKSGSRTLLTSVILSSPGPLVVGWGLMLGQSSTQLADFFRRSAELLAIICAYVIYRITTKDGACDEARRARLERGANMFVGAMMCVAGVIMIALALFSGHAEKGNVAPGLVIAVMGVIANGIFWRRYTKLDKADPNAVLAVQARLYRAKTFVDGCVTVALTTVLLMPGSQVSVVIDLVGSLVVSAYLVYCGAKTIWQAKGLGTGQ